MMKDIIGLGLCDYRTDRLEVHVQADYCNGKLTISGQDLGSVTEGFWGDLDYEYWYYFDEAETSKLISAIKGESDLQASLLREFSGEGGCRALREICEKHGIQYRFDSWV